jgi:hypothetical protein
VADIRQFVLNHKSCVACHGPAAPVKAAPGDWKKAHDEVTRLMDEAARQRERAAATQARLRAELDRLEELLRVERARKKEPRKLDVRPSTDDTRIELLEKKLAVVTRQREEAQRTEAALRSELLRTCSRQSGRGRRSQRGARRRSAWRTWSRSSTRCSRRWRPCAAS